MLQSAATGFASKMTDFAPMPTLLFREIHIQFSELGKRLEGGRDIGETSKQSLHSEITSTEIYRQKSKGLKRTNVCCQAIGVKTQKTQ